MQVADSIEYMPVKRIDSDSEGDSDGHRVIIKRDQITWNQKVVFVLFCFFLLVSFVYIYNQQKTILEKLERFNGSENLNLVQSEKENENETKQTLEEVRDISYRTVISQKKLLLQMEMLDTKVEIMRENKAILRAADPPPAAISKTPPAVASPPAAISKTPPAVASPPAAISKTFPVASPAKKTKKIQSGIEIISYNGDFHVADFNPEIVNHDCYAKMHGYSISPDFHFDGTKEGLAVQWAKPLVILNAMKNDDAEWFLWVDRDAQFLECRIKLEDIIKEATKTNGGTAPDLIITDMLRGLNNGVMLLRNTPWIKSLLALWRELGKAAQEAGFMFVTNDQGGMIFILQHGFEEAQKIVEKRGDPAKLKQVKDDRASGTPSDLRKVEEFHPSMKGKMVIYTPKILNSHPGWVLCANVPDCDADKDAWWRKTLGMHPWTVGGEKYSVPLIEHFVGALKDNTTQITEHRNKYSNCKC